MGCAAGWMTSVTVGCDVAVGCRLSGVGCRGVARVDVGVGCRCRRLETRFVTLPPDSRQPTADSRHPTPNLRSREALHRTLEVIDFVDHLLRDVADFLLHLAAGHRCIEQRGGGAGNGSDGEDPRENSRTISYGRTWSLLSPDNVCGASKSRDDRCHGSMCAANVSAITRTRRFHHVALFGAVR